MQDSFTSPERHCKNRVRRRRGEVDEHGIPHPETQYAGYTSSGHEHFSRFRLLRGRKASRFRLPASLRRAGRVDRGRDAGARRVGAAPGCERMRRARRRDARVPAPADRRDRGTELRASDSGPPIPRTPGGAHRRAGLRASARSRDRGSAHRGKRAPVLGNRRLARPRRLAGMRRAMFSVTSTTSPTTPATRTSAPIRPPSASSTTRTPATSLASSA